MQQVLKQTMFWVCLLTGIGLLYIGLRFFLNPVAAETDYGIHTVTNGDFSFQYIKAVRDFFLGSIILILLWSKEWRALGFVLLLGTIIPAVDFCIVISHTDFIVAHLYAHLIAVIICLVCGFYYTINSKKLNQ